MYKIPYLIWLFLFGLTAGTPDTSWAKAERVSIVLPYIPLMAESPTQGLFIQMFEEVAKRTGQEITIDILPPAARCRPLFPGNTIPWERFRRSANYQFRWHQHPITCEKT